MKLPLAYFGDAILRKKTIPVNEVNQEIRQLVADMIETMHSVNGIGLAAPQVHKSLSIFITQAPIEQPDGRWTTGRIRIFINPTILSISEESNIRSEGCLSIPKIYQDVERPIWLKIRATDIDGKTFEEEFSGLDARCILHENDHINGVLFIDRLPKKVRKMLEPALQRIKKTLSGKN